MTDNGVKIEHQADWDASVEMLGGDLLQLWNWGEFKSRYGWTVERIASPRGSMAQVLFRRLGPLTLAYLPRGPVFGHHARDDLELLDGIDDACARRRAISLIVEPSQPLPKSWMSHGAGFVPASRTIQSPRTVLVDLTLDDDALLKQMRKDTRYNISYARRNGMTVERAGITNDTVDEFFFLLNDTANRGEFGIHDRAYYADFLDLFGSQSVLLFARTGGHITAGLIASACGASARSMYAGTRHRIRPRGDAALLRFSAMQWARERGCTAYDLGGIAPINPETVDADHPDTPAEAVKGLMGVENFKTGFGGNTIAFPPTIERLYHPNLVRIANRLRGWASASTTE